MERVAICKLALAIMLFLPFWGDRGAAKKSVSKLFDGEGSDKSSQTNILSGTPRLFHISWISLLIVKMRGFMTLYRPFCAHNFSADGPTAFNLKGSFGSRSRV